jgi:hypothetical protein
VAKIKYDVSDVEDVTEGKQAPVGIYRAKVRSVEGPVKSSNGNTMLVVAYDLTHDAAGKKVPSGKEGFAPIWDRPLTDHDHPFVQAKWRQFLLAFGLKPKGVLDTDKIVGKSVQLKLKSDTDDGGDYRPRIGKIMALAEVEDGGAEEPPEEIEPEEEEEEAAEVEAEEEDGIDLDTLDRAELKKLIKEEELEIKVLKSMSDDDIRSKIADAMGAEDEEEEEAEAEEEEAEEEADADAGEDYTSWSVEKLKAEVKEREIEMPKGSGLKGKLVNALREDDGDEPF